MSGGEFDKDAMLAETAELLQKSRELGEHEAIVNGRSYVVFQDVFSPSLFACTDFLAKALPFPKGKRFLEIGSGCGCIAVEAAIAGCHVTATDIFPTAIENTYVNATRYKVTLKALVSDVFDGLAKSDKFDFIFWSIPAAPACFDKPESELDVLERSVFDPNFKLLERYLGGARDFLNPDGQLWIEYSEDGANFETFKQIAKKHNWNPVRHGEPFRPIGESHTTVSISLFFLKNITP